LIDEMCASPSRSASWNSAASAGNRRRRPNRPVGSWLLGGRLAIFPHRFAPPACREQVSACSISKLISQPALVYGSCDDHRAHAHCNQGKCTLPRTWFGEIAFKHGHHALEYLTKGRLHRGSRSCHIGRQCHERT
jgi:hypothetical protein